MTPLESGAQVANFKIFSKSEPDGEGQESPPAWTLHATGKITPRVVTTRTTSLPDLQANINEALSVTAYYEQFREKGIEYGPSFQAIAALFRDEGQALGLIRLPESLHGQVDAYKLHPVLLDGCFQLIGAAFGNAAPGLRGEQTYLPVGCQRLEYVAPLAKLSEVWCHVDLSQSSQSKGFNADLRLFSPEGEVIASVTGLQLKPASRKAVLVGGRRGRIGSMRSSGKQKPRYGANHYLRNAL